MAFEGTQAALKQFVEGFVRTGEWKYIRLLKSTSLPPLLPLFPPLLGFY